MNANELYLADGQATGIWFCETCRMVARSKELADRCCEPVLCNVCGKPVDEKFWATCGACRRKKAAETEAALFEKAVKIPDTEYKDWVTDGDNFWEDTASYLEELDGEEPSKYLWATRPKRFVRVHTSSILEHICDEGYEDFCTDDLIGWDEFLAAVSAFEEANAGVVCYEADFSRAILVTPESTGV